MKTVRALARGAAVVSAIVGAGSASAQSGDVNVYTYRESKLIQPLFDAFSRDTGIKVNVISASSGLEQRIKAEGANSPADVLLTVDIGRIEDAVRAGITQPIKSDVLDKIVAPQYRDPEGHWYGISMRARVVYASKDRVKETALKYEDLSDPKWKGKICIRCAPALPSIPPSRGTASSMPIRFRFPRSPTTRRQRPTWWTRSDSITDPMIPAQPAGRPSMDRWPARFHLRWQAPAFGAMAVATGLVAIAPLASLIALAFGETGDLWAHLARYVIPAAFAQTALLLAGVAVVTIIIGASTAWLVTTFAFPGRDALSWLLRLTSMSTSSTRSAPCNRRCERFSAGTPPPTIGFRTSAHSPAQFSFSASCSIHTFISPRARCFRLRVHYSPSPHACSARDPGNSRGASLCRWRGRQ